MTIDLLNFAMEAFVLEKMGKVQDITVHSDTESFATDNSHDISLTEEHYNVKLTSSKRKIERDKPLPELMRREKSIEYESSSDIIERNPQSIVKEKEEPRRKIIDNESSPQKSLIFDSVDEIIDNAAYSYPFDEEAALDFVQITTVDINDLKRGMDKEYKDDKLDFVLGECENSPIEAPRRPLSFQNEQSNKMEKFNKGIVSEMISNEKIEKHDIVPVISTGSEIHRKKNSDPILKHYVYEYFVPELFLEKIETIEMKQKNEKKEPKHEEIKKIINQHHINYEQTEKASRSKGSSLNDEKPYLVKLKTLATNQASFKKENKENHIKEWNNERMGADQHHRHSLEKQFFKNLIDKEKKASVNEGIKTDISGRIPILIKPRNLNQMKSESSVKDLKGSIFEGLSEQDRLALWKNLLDLDHLNLFPSNVNFLDDDVTNQIITNIYPLSKEFDYSRDKLRQVLASYRSYDNELEVSPNMVFVAGVLCLMFDKTLSLEAYKKLMFRKELRRNFVSELQGIECRTFQFNELLKEKDAFMFEFLNQKDVNVEEFATNWFGTIFAYRFPLEFTYRMYDWFVIDGFNAVLKMSLALVTENRQELFRLDSKDEILLFLNTKLLKTHEDLSHWFLLADSIRIDDQKLKILEEQFYLDLYAKLLYINEDIMISSDETNKLLLIRFNELYELLKKVLQEKNEFLKKGLNRNVRIFIMEKLLCSINK